LEATPQSVKTSSHSIPVKKTLLALVLLGAGVALAQLYVESVAYFPVVKIASPGGLGFTIVHDALGSRQSCGTANREVLHPIRADCKECKLVYAKGAELALLQRKALPFYMVSASNIRLLVTGPPAVARRACEDLASNIVKSGLQTATCLYPSL